MKFGRFHGCEPINQITQITQVKNFPSQKGQGAIRVPTATRKPGKMTTVFPVLEK